MSAETVSSFISHLVLHFGEPKYDVPDLDKKKAHSEWLKSMVRALKSFSDDCLTKAAEIIVTTRKYRSFPLLSECLDACHDAQNWLNAQKPSMKFGGHAPTVIPEWAPHRMRLADELVMGDMGRRAAREGWVSALHEFIRREMRLPSGAEIKTCIEDAKSVDDWTERAARGECGPLSRAVMQLGQSKLKRRDELKAMILDGVMP